MFRHWQVDKKLYKVIYTYIRNQKLYKLIYGGGKVLTND
jgi:hypothetical protein